MDGMDILYLLIPLSVILVFAIAAGFWWSLKTGQFDDLDGPGYRILMDDDRTRRPANANDPNPSQANDEPRQAPPGQ